MVASAGVCSGWTRAAWLAREEGGNGLASSWGGERETSGRQPVGQL